MLFLADIAIPMKPSAQGLSVLFLYLKECCG